MKVKHFFGYSFFVLTLILGLVLSGCIKEEEENLPPSITITSPAEGSTYSDHETVNISVNVADEDGEIRQVMYYVNDVYVQTASNSPWGYTWNTSGYGMGYHVIKAKAIDDDGEVAAAILNVAVIASPTAGFSVNKRNIFEGATAIFTDESINVPASWEWDFGDGNTSTEQNPTHIYDSVGVFTVSLKVTNSVGTDTETKSDYISVLTTKFTDARDNQEYRLVEIGTQIWMAENLNYEVLGSNCWYYNNNTSLADPYGRLYDWDNSLAVCPSGWHLPSLAEWDTLVNYLGGNMTAGSKLKEAGTSHWTAPNADATNASGFNAVGGGARDNANGFEHLGLIGYFWTAEEGVGGFGTAIYKKLYNNSGEVGQGDVYQSNAYSVRCVKD